MKRTIPLLALVILLCVSACGTSAPGDDAAAQSDAATPPAQTPIQTIAIEQNTPDGEAQPAQTATPARGILVAYFSATGTTRPLAEYAAEILDADLYEIVPETPYTAEDLDYYSGGRADREQDDPAARPAIAGAVANMAQYDVVLLGYPIWHGQAPKIIRTFLESYDFAGKTILPFCTSHSSGIGSSASNLHPLCPDANWLDGARFAAGTARADIEAWLDGFALKADAPAAAGAFNFETRTVLLNSGYEM
ncbi:MAG: flavodoxin, partial [Clostridia bacterium]|nr:flavodoxin [Clostridia bacterium]